MSAFDPKRTWASSSARLCQYRPETSGSVMRRRELIALLGGVAAWPLTARAQQAGRVMRIGVLMSYVESDTTAHQWTKAFSQSLQESGWIDNQNIKFEYRWAGPNPDLLQASAAELVRLKPNLLLAGATPALVALQRETRDIPIVFANVADPVGQGLRADCGPLCFVYNCERRNCRDDRAATTAR